MRRIFAPIAERAFGKLMTDLEDEMAEALELGMAWRAARRNLDGRIALTVSSTGQSATASVFRPDAAGHAIHVHSERGTSAVDALDNLHSWLLVNEVRP